MNLQAVWRELSAEPGSDGAAWRRLWPESKFDLFAYLDLKTSTPSFQFHRSWKPVDQRPALPATSGLRCRSELHDGGKELRVVVELADLTLADTFSPLVEDLASRVVAAGSEQQALTALAEGLGDWKRLLEALALNGMGTLERRGLAGELIVLSESLLPTRGSGSVSAWTGPRKANQDFQFGDLAIEVKVTTGKQPQGFRVANERELDDRHIGLLLLAHLSLDEREGGQGKNLNDLVEDVTVALSGDPEARALFQELLGRVGYLQRDRDHYVEPRYGVRNARWFEVGEGFPRLIEADLPDGVGDVSFSVALSACSVFELDAGVVRSRLESRH